MNSYSSSPSAEYSNHDADASRNHWNRDRRPKRKSPISTTLGQHQRLPHHHGRKSSSPSENQNQYSPSPISVTIRKQPSSRTSMQKLPALRQQQDALKRQLADSDEIREDVDISKQLAPPFRPSSLLYNNLKNSPYGELRDLNPFPVQNRRKRRAPLKPTARLRHQGQDTEHVRRNASPLTTKSPTFHSDSTNAHPRSGSKSPRKKQSTRLPSLQQQKTSHTQQSQRSFSSLSARTPHNFAAASLLHSSKKTPSPRSPLSDATNMRNGPLRRHTIAQKPLQAQKHSSVPNIISSHWTQQKESLSARRSSSSLANISSARRFANKNSSHYPQALKPLKSQMFQVSTHRLFKLYKNTHIWDTMEATNFRSTYCQLPSKRAIEAISEEIERIESMQHLMHELDQYIHTRELQIEYLQRLVHSYASHQFKKHSKHLMRKKVRRVWNRLHQSKKKILSSLKDYNDRFGHMQEYLWRGSPEVDSPRTDAILARNSKVLHSPVQQRRRKLDKLPSSSSIQSAGAQSNISPDHPIKYEEKMKTDLDFFRNSALFRMIKRKKRIMQNDDIDSIVSENDENDEDSSDEEESNSAWATVRHSQNVSIDTLSSRSRDSTSDLSNESSEEEYNSIIQEDESRTSFSNSPKNLLTVDPNEREEAEKALLSMMEELTPQSESKDEMPAMEDEGTETREEEEQAEECINSPSSQEILDAKLQQCRLKEQEEFEEFLSMIRSRYDSYHDRRLHMRKANTATSSEDDDDIESGPLRVPKQFVDSSTGMRLTYLSHASDSGSDSDSNYSDTLGSNIYLRASDLPTPELIRWWKGAEKRLNQLLSPLWRGYHSRQVQQLQEESARKIQMQWFAYVKLKQVARYYLNPNTMEGRTLRRIRCNLWHLKHDALVSQQRIQWLQEWNEKIGKIRRDSPPLDPLCNGSAQLLDSAQDRAAIRIQRLFRGYSARCLCQKLMREAARHSSCHHDDETMELSPETLHSDVEKTRVQAFS